MKIFSRGGGMNFLYGGTLAFAAALYIVLETGFCAGVSPLLAACALPPLLVLALRTDRPGRRNIFLLCFFFCLGLADGLGAGLCAAEQLEKFFGREVVATGWAEPLSVRAGEGRASLLLRCETLRAGGKIIPYAGRLRLTLSQAAGTQEDLGAFSGRGNSAGAGGNNNNNNYINYACSGRLRVRGTLAPLTHFRNPGCFDGALYNRINEIGGRLQKAVLLGREDTPAWTWARAEEKLAAWNEAARAELERGMGRRAGALLGGMLLGGSGALDEGTREIFAANGLAHLLSVSGTHLVLLASWLKILLSPLPACWRGGLLSFFLVLYAALCGARPPVLRALLMCLVLAWGRKGEDEEGQAREEAERGHLFALVALLLLLLRPLWLLDIGFQLSFAATAGLIWLLPACLRALPGVLPDFIKEGLAVTMAAQFASLPFLISNFHQLSLISFVSNLLLVPVLEFAALLALAGAALQNLALPFAVETGAAFLRGSAFFVEQVLAQGGMLAGLEWSQIVVGALPAWSALVYYALLFIAADVPAAQFFVRGERKLLMALGAIILAACLFYKNFLPQPLRAYFLDVGQGDCVVITTPARRTIVYDTGGLAGMDTGKSIVAPFVRSLGRSGIDMLILSHYDYDHAGGAPGLLAAMRVRELLLPDEALDESSLPLYEKIAGAAAMHGTRVRIARHGAAFPLGGQSLLTLAVPAQFLPRAEEADGEEGRPRGNDASTVARVFSPHGSLLLTGDLGSEGERALEAEPCTVLKAGHHGSKNSSCEEFLSRVRPRICVLSCAQGNRYGHPHRETLERLERAGCAIYSTAEGGCTQVVFDESGARCYSYVNERF